MLVPDGVMDQDGVLVGDGAPGSISASAAKLELGARLIFVSGRGGKSKMTGAQERGQVVYEAHPDDE